MSGISDHVARNRRSSSVGISDHNRPESAITMVRNTQYSLIEQYALLLDILKKLEPLRNDDLRHAKLGRMFVPGYNVKIDFESLLFLLERPKPTLLLAELSLADSLFEAVLFGVKLYDEAYLELYMRTHVQIAKQKNLSQYLQDPDNALDTTLTQRLKSATDTLYDTTDRALEVNKKAVLNLDEYLRNAFPDALHLNMDTIRIDRINE